MRITGGRLKGETLHAAPRHVRPAMDRMRESLFARLGPLDDLRVLDLFSGSGSLALEAISRGAGPVVAVERDRRVCSVTRANLKGTDCLIYCMPAERFLTRCAKENSRYDLIFADPPFAYRYRRELIERIATIAGSPARVVVHYPATESLPATIGALVRSNLRDYGHSRIAIYAAENQMV